MFRPLFFALTTLVGIRITEDSNLFAISFIILDAIIFLYLLNYVITSKLRKYTLFGFFIAIFFIGLILLSYFRLGFKGSALSYYLKYYLSLSLPYFFLGIMNNYSLPGFQIRLLKYASIMSIFVVLSFSLFTVSYSGQIQRLTNINSLNYQNIGYYLTYSAIIIFLYSFYAKKAVRLLYLLLFIIAALLVVFTGARGPLVTLFIGTLTTVFFYSKKAFFFLLISFTLIMFTLTPFMEFLFETFTSFSSGITRSLSFLYLNENTLYSLPDTLGTREPLYRNAITLFGEYPFFGVGTGGFSLLTRSNTYPHNVFLEILSEYGVLGILTVFFVTIYFLRKIQKRFQNEYVIIILMYVYSITQLLFSSSFLVTFELWFAIGSTFSFIDRVDVKRPRVKKTISKY